MDEAAKKSPLHGLLSAAVTPGDSVVKRSLEAIRVHLGMEVAYISEFAGDRAVYREIDAPGIDTPVKPGDSLSLDDIYCGHILAGRLPQLMPDTAKVPLAASMPVTHALPIGKHISVPIRMPDGSVYGMFCCLGPRPDPDLRERDLQMMNVFADLAAFEIHQSREQEKARQIIEDRIQGAIEAKQLSAVYQPIFRLQDRRLVGFECLARFSAEPSRTPDKWFLEAAEIGKDVELELTAIQLALASMPSLPHDVYLAVNASPNLILSGRLAEALGSAALRNVTLEVTEHAHVGDYSAMNEALAPLRRKGVQLAIDDAGAGYASLQHILQLQPDIIKLDMELTRNIDADPARRALAAALVAFARETGARIIAEGVETEAELATLRQLGIEKAQGYLLGRPMRLDAARELLDAHEARAAVAA